MIKSGNRMISASLQKKPEMSDGFTLVEVMIGMAIFLIGFLAVGSMQLSAVSNNTGAREATEAATRAAGRLETLISLPYENIVSGGPETDGAYDVSWTVTDDLAVTQYQNDPGNGRLSAPWSPQLRGDLHENR